MTERSSDRWRRIGIGVFALPTFVLLASLSVMKKASAHDSWISRESITDPISKEWCCNHIDCAEEVDNIEAIEGGYLVKSTGEVIERERVIWRSPGGWWRCRYIGGPKNGQTRCLIGPPPAS